MDSAEYSPYFMSPNLESSTGSAPTLTTAYGWFRSCYSTHASCRRLASFNPNQLPTRLIDVGNDGDTDWFLRVVREDGIASPSAPYMTLSYRWGNPTISLLSSNITRFRRGSPIADLPSTFQDFIAVARRFGIQYVWIDALCVVQDSTEDWEAEPSTMSHVYANSACNIAASASNYPEEGLFRPREPDLVRPGKVLTSLFADKPSPHYIFDKGYWDRQLFAGPLHNRGWVFQECFLAPRVLYFGKDQILWECLCEHKCEGFPQGIPAHYSDKNMDPLLDSISAGRSRLPGKGSPLVFYLWNSLVEQYSTCHLTEPSDKMVAIAGIARLFGQITGDEYVADW
ncbi:hypothetical protein ETB97_004956 [Aspergillus alliaceus]|uniref:Heterokaryon incompatibility domain-containing protein n=1 Tax=Petromyces alliaceus TaxID=209559 RepID=A0A8H5ZZR8_PETAA|nr:hypothetical protein ETB97_004956 [Aspergillus burnettii]